ncbi:MAG: ABC transporter ATP-binding protein [Chloroflexi bacterium 13_1_20CM_4_66_15]|nr:MAG: ABC transporter ATP-binding protein [Chloroflexi bacterium 13_1_20CM_4_66_15]
MSLQAQLQARVGSFDLDVDLSIAPGEVVALLGPNGAGKTSVLRALAGLLTIDAGRIALDGIVLDEPAKAIRMPVEQRPIGVVFQDYLLFPHLSVLENVAFGLRSRGVGRTTATARARSWLDRVGLGPAANRKPASLSGGQAQRVALVRALATDPALLLLDEPMAALDVSTRVELRRELRQHLESFRGVRLLVTHDPVEAMAMADRLIVLEHGRVLQTGSPAEVTQRPRSRYVADLVGVNLFRGTARQNVITITGGGSLTAVGVTDGDVFAVVHPRTVALYRARPDGTPRNVWEGRATDLDLQGDRVRVRLEGSPSIVAEVTPAAVRELGLDRGDQGWIGVKATEVIVYPA